MKLKKFFAVCTTVLLAVGLAGVGTAAAVADGGVTTIDWDVSHNQASYWTDYGPHDGASCYKLDANSNGVSSSDHGSSRGNTVTLNTFNQSWPGDHWELLVIKAGLKETVVTHPDAGVAYSAPGGKDVSHWIVCKGTTPPTVIEVVPAATFTDVCGTVNDLVSTPDDTGALDYTETWNQAHTSVTVTVVAIGNNTIKDGVVTSWSHTFTNEPCPTVIEVVPAATFTDVCGTVNDLVSTPDDTGALDYTETWNQAHNLVTVTVVAIGNNTIKDGVVTSWSHTFTNEPCPTEIDEVPAATFTDVCGTANDSVSTPDDTDALDYTETWNQAHTSVTVTVVAIGNNTIKDGVETSWSHTFTNEPCPTITPLAPSAFDPTCPEEQDATIGYIQLDLKDHLHYTIDGVSTTQARNELAPGTYTISVTADSGFTLSGPASWEMTINPAFCPPTLALLSTTASMQNITCPAAGSYTLANTEGIQWLVNGVLTPAGTYTVADASTVNVEAQLVDSVNDGWEDGAQKTWTFNFTDPADCDLPTLAFTGTSGGNLGLLLAGGFLLFGGAIIAFERRFRLDAR